MRTWGQSKISSSCICVWSESWELGYRSSSWFPCVTPVLETSSDRVAFWILSNINDGAPLWKQPSALTCRLFPQKKLHHRPLTRFQMRIWLEALWMWGVCELQAHGICNRTLVYKEVVEVQSDYKKSHFWWCWLLQLNLGTRGEHLNRQLSWVVAWLLVTLVCPVYQVEEHCYFGVICF